jgi:hypothetical protein
LTNFSEDFEEALDLDDGEVEWGLSREPETLNETEFGDLHIRFVSNLKVRSTVPKVEISYFSNSNIENAKGDILKLEDGEVQWDHAIPGHQYPTDGIAFLHRIDDLRPKLGSNNNKQAITAAYSAGYGLRSIISRKLGVDSLDTQCSVTMSQRFVQLIVHDADVGGAGLCHAVYQDLDDFLWETRTSLDDCVCDGFCEQCLLLPRTPTHIVEGGLLNRFDGLEFLSE